MLHMNRIGQWKSRALRAEAENERLIELVVALDTDTAAAEAERDRYREALEDKDQTIASLTTLNADLLKMHEDLLPALTEPED